MEPTDPPNRLPGTNPLIEMGHISFGIQKHLRQDLKTDDREELGDFEIELANEANGAIGKMQQLHQLR